MTHADTLDPTSPAPTYRVEFVERTGLERLETGRGSARLRMPLAGNENHVGVLYMGAYTVLAEAVAAIPGISILDTKRYFPILKDISVAFHRSAASDVTAEYRLSEDVLQELLADLERKGSATYVAEFPMHDAQGIHVASGRVTVKLLSHHWPLKGE
jgi:acyl-coenzyme A thioesterase PaaI-like protein